MGRRGPASAKLANIGQPWSKLDRSSATGAVDNFRSRLSRKKSTREKSGTRARAPQQQKKHSAIAILARLRRESRGAHTPPSRDPPAAPQRCIGVVGSTRMGQLVLQVFDGPGPGQANPVLPSWLPATPPPPAELRSTCPTASCGFPIELPPQTSCGRGDAELVPRLASLIETLQKVGPKVGGVSGGLGPAPRLESTEVGRVRTEIGHVRQHEA